MLDTGSTDDTVAVFESWAKRQPLALGYRVATTSPLPRNAANELLDTDWLGWADCDDDNRIARRVALECCALAA